MTPPKAIGKNSNESAVSPATVETMARTEKCRSPLRNFIRLITYALRNDPTRNAARLATTILGAMPKTKLKCSSPSQNGAGGSATATSPSVTTKLFIAKPVQMMSPALRKPHTSVMQSLMI